MCALLKFSNIQFQEQLRPIRLYKDFPCELPILQLSLPEVIEVTDHAGHADVPVFSCMA